jgi:CubicO group peptidase (beta-lactamase class C family)
MAVAVVVRGKVLVAKGYGLANVELGVPANPETLFQAGSLGKQFLAALVLRLVEDGKISLDDSITKFYPDAPWRWRGITIRHLLTHTSGIPDYEDDKFDLRKDYTEDELARYAFSLKLDFEPGARWSYSNTGYMLLGTIIRKVTGRFYGDVLGENVFGPLGMKTSRIISEADIIPNRASGYRLDKGELKNQEWISPSLNSTADGCLYVSILDMVAWDRGLRSKALLKAGSWEAMFTPVVLQSGKTYPYGFGWEVDNYAGQRRQRHSGSWQGFKAYIARYLGDDLTVVVLANLAEAKVDKMVADIAAFVDPKLAPRTEPIPDREPGVTERVRKLLESAAHGTLNPEEFGYVGSSFFPGVAKDIQAQLIAAGPVTRLELMEVREEGDDRVFRYRLTTTQGKVLNLEVGFAPDSKVSTFNAW